MHVAGLVGSASRLAGRLKKGGTSPTLLRVGNLNAEIIPKLKTKLQEAETRLNQAKAAVDAAQKEKETAAGAYFKLPDGKTERAKKKNKTARNTYLNALQKLEDAVSHEQQLSREHMRAGLKLEDAVKARNKLIERFNNEQKYPAIPFGNW